MSAFRESKLCAAAGGTTERRASPVSSPWGPGNAPSARDPFWFPRHFPAGMLCAKMGGHKGPCTFCFISADALRLPKIKTVLTHRHSLTGDMDQLTSTLLKDKSGKVALRKKVLCLCIP